MRVLPILAWRSWRTIPNSPHLYSLGSPQAWETIENAKCSSLIYSARVDKESHKSPHEKCECGVYATSSRQYAEHYRERFAPWDLPRSYFILAALVGWALLMFPSLLLYSHLPNIFTTNIVLFFTIVFGPAVGMYLAVMYFPRRNKGVLGIVALSGKILVYDQVIRSQRAEVICLIRPFSLPKNQALLIAEKYNVPLFEFWQWKKAWQYAHEHGTDLRL